MTSTNKNKIKKFLAGISRMEQFLGEREKHV